MSSQIEPRAAERPDEHIADAAFLRKIAVAKERTRLHLEAYPDHTKLTEEEIARDRRCHGLFGEFPLQLGESRAVYNAFVEEVYAEYKPQTGTETRLAQSLIQHHWLVQRAIRLQEQVLGEDDKKLTLYMRYQATHERSYYKAQKELQKLVKERTKEQIGFESQNRKQEAHEAKVRLAHAQAERIDTDTACRQAMEAPMPGTTKIGFEQLTKACSEAIAALVHQSQQTAA